MTTTTYARQDCLVLPYAATSEDKAGMFADAIEAIFLDDVKTEVFEDGGNWFVAVVEGEDQIGDSIRGENINAAVILLMRFDLVAATSDIMPLEASISDIPAAQEALAKRARRAFRIEEKLDRILAKLDGFPEAAHADA